MEQGPFLNLELLPEATRPQGPTLRRLLGASTLQGAIFRSAGVEVLLEPGFAYVLVGETPSVTWPTSPTDPLPVPDSAASGPAVGPGVMPPDTLGEVLLACRADPPMRNMLVFVPRIPAELWQPYQTATETGSAEDRMTHAVNE
jgi:hypothetical protein